MIETGKGHPINQKIYITNLCMIFMNKLGMSILIIGLILLSYGIKAGQHVDTENIATYICLSCLGLTPAGYETGIESTGIEKLNHEVEIIVFSAEWCKYCPEAIATAKEIAESSEFIDYRVIEYEKNPEEFEKYGVSINGLPCTIVIVDNEVKGTFYGAYKLDSKILDVIEKSIEE